MHASVPPTPEALAAEMLEFWHSLMRGSAKSAWQVLEELGVSMSQVKALHTLSETGAEVSVKELAEQLGMSLPNASRTVDALHRAGYIARREDERDRRVKRVGITDAGRALVERVDTARLHDLKSWAQSLSPEQRTTLLAAISSLPHKDVTP